MTRISRNGSAKRSTASNYKAFGLPVQALTGDHGTSLVIVDFEVGDFADLPESVEKASEALKEFEADPEFAALMQEARRELSETFRKEGVSELAVCRLARGLSQAELANRLSIAQPKISLLENGGQIPNVVFAKRWATALGISTDDLAEAVERARLKWANDNG